MYTRGTLQGGGCGGDIWHQGGFHARGTFGIPRIEGKQQDSNTPTGQRGRQIWGERNMPNQVSVIKIKVFPLRFKN